jgi:hypothetical protein
MERTIVERTSPRSDPKRAQTEGKEGNQKEDEQDRLVGWSKEYIGI